MRQQGGGIYSRGLQHDTLGATGALIVNHTIIISNTASFGGGIACDSCRAIIAAHIDDNVAVRSEEGLEDTSMRGAWWHGPPASRAGTGSAGGSCVNGSHGAVGTAAAAISSVRRLRHAVLGAGGGIAANMAGNSYVVLCKADGTGTSSSRGASSLQNNTAMALGGAVYINTTAIAPDCPFPQPGRDLTESCFPGGYWPKACGFNT
jgi:hypothetical protein